MERGKGPGRGGKSKTPLFPADLYALGSKTSNEGKPRQAASNLGSKVAPSLSNVSEIEKKRDGGPIGGSTAASKKAKLSSGSSVTSSASGSASVGFVAKSGTTSGSGSPSSSSSDSWESAALDIDPADLATQVFDAALAKDYDKLVGYLCGAVKILRSQRFKPDMILFQSLSYIARTHPEFFNNVCVYNALCSLLKRENAFAFKSKGNVSTLYLTVNLLMSAFHDVKKWPDIFIKVYVEDAQGERAWVDHELCKQFVDNIVASVATKRIPLSVSDVVPHEEETAPAQPSAQPPPPPATPRFRWNKDAIENFVVENVKEQVMRKQGGADLVNRNFIRMLTSLCGIPEVRVMAASKLEVWLQNPKLMRCAQELLMSVCVNATSHTLRDVEIISLLIKMRLKTKALGTYYLACVKELVSGHPDNLGTVLKHTVYNELSTPRNPNNNMAMLSVVLQYDPDRAATFLADIFLELLYNREDYLRSVRGLLREMARVLRSELRLVVLVQRMLAREEPLPRDADPARAFAAVADVVTLATFLLVLPHLRSDKKDTHQIEKMQVTVSQVQYEVINWFYTSVLPLYRPSSADFIHVLHKVLLLEPGEVYSKADNWPEQERGALMRLACEAPLQEASVIRLLALGLNKEYPFPPQDALDFTEQLVKRAAAVPNPIIPLLTVEKMKLVEFVLKCCAYHHPEKLELPAGYVPPSLAITAHYWKAWTVLLVLAAHNPARLGALAWSKYPTLHTLMEMCITGHFAFQPGFDDLQMLALEKQTILEFESHLAAASTKMEITEATSLLLPQLMSMEPEGVARRPPPATLEHIRGLNTGLRLGHLLCRSRDPDFLLDIIQRQGPSQSMPWLADLVHSSDGSLNHLPVQCLCEFLMSCSPKQESRYQELLAHLRAIVTCPSEDSAPASELLDYFLRRLSSPTNRSLAISGLKLVLSPVSDDAVMDLDRSQEEKGDTYWLTGQLPLLPHFKTVRPQVVSSLRAACQVENEPSLVTCYLTFLADHSTDELSELSELVLDMATLIVERTTIMAAILPSTTEPNPALDAFLNIFHTYLTKAREPRRGEYTWSESQDQVLVSWYTGEECTIHILVVHAIVILLTYGPNAFMNHLQYNTLLDIWFPHDMDNAPKGFLVDTSEEALLIPDWLKLRMIRSHVPRLVQAALTDLDISQLILFIQSFGIPIASMSKLLSRLDSAAVYQREAVCEAVMDKQYMGQLVEVQHRRGAVGGNAFITVLELDKVDKAPGCDTPLPTLPSRVVKERQVKQTLPANEDEILSTLERFYTTDIDPAIEKETFRILQLGLVELMRSREERACRPNDALKYILFNLLRLVTVNRQFVSSMLAKAQYSAPILRLFIAHNPDPLTLTIILKKILEVTKDCSTPKYLMDILTQYLRSEDIITPVEAKKKARQESREEILVDTMQRLLITSSPLSGHLVDKLVGLEPEILGTSSDLQMKLLFSLEDGKSLHCRPYLVTLLTHHASWHTLHHCTDILLQPHSVPRLDPTAVLDFLQALVANPKLWQGREKHTPKHNTYDNVLNLNLEQVKCVVEYVVSEGVVGSEAGRDPAEVSRVMASRLSLLEQAVRAMHTNTAPTLGSHLASRTLASTSREKLICNELLVQLYMKIPSLICKLKPFEVKLINNHPSISVSGRSGLDVLSHCLLTALASSPPTKDSNKKAHDLDLAVRNMAATHPLLTLRQVGLIACSLRGRVELDWCVLKGRGHLVYLQQVSSLLLLLQPHIFLPCYTTPFHTIIDTFLHFFLNYGYEHGSQNNVAALLTNFSQLMQNYIRHKPKTAQTYFQSKAEIIKELQCMGLTAVQNLCVVVTRIGGGLEIYVTPTSSSEPLPPLWEAKLTLITSKQDVTGGLSYLEYSTSKRPGLLSPLVPLLTSLLSSPSSQVCGLAHTLVARYLRHDPSAARALFPTYLALLDSAHPDVVTTALHHLPEFVLLAQEVGVTILKKLFIMGTQYNINTGESISRIISLLNLQSAC